MFTLHARRDNDSTTGRGLIPRPVGHRMRMRGKSRGIIRAGLRWIILLVTLLCSQLPATTCDQEKDAVMGGRDSLPVILFDSISYDSYNPDTFLHTSLGIERGFRSMGYKGNLRVHRFGYALESGMPYLSLHFYEYSAKRIRLIAFYVKDGERRKAGYYSQSLSVDLGPEEAPEWMIEQIGRRLIEELHNRFPADFTLEPELDDAS